ncbi:unnamed protein product [Clonostachys chloroleuca]|uniref:Rhodopsin domain-containing protein n=1 Tax=Clonostachys chloroleuca TaxID=1926264 RepID=A0AA35QES6_9HYPO|nr:unnamed protein product [Clonostachys chloroleuca]
MTQAGWEVAKLHGLAEAVLIVTITFSALMSLVFFLRLGIRLRYQELMREDYLMGAGYVLNLVQNAFACYCAYNGVGLPDSEIPGGKNGPTYNEGLKAVFLWQLFYLTSMAFIKSSICLTILRIAIIRWQRILLWTIIGLSFFIAVILDIFILVECKPIARIWNEEPGWCYPNSAKVAITFITSGVNIVTDWICTILPIFIIWKLQMPKQRKVALSFVLGAGCMASIATLVRLPSASAYFEEYDYLKELGTKVTWTIIETDIAVIAGCLPALRRLVKGLQSNRPSKAYPNSDNKLLALVSWKSSKKGSQKDAQKGTPKVPQDPYSPYRTYMPNDSLEELGSTKSIITPGPIVK